VTPTKKTTPEQYAVILFTLGAVLAILGVIALVAGFGAPEIKHETATELTRRGWWSLGMGCFVFAILWTVRRLREG
jgi:hypothetical protein